MIYDSHSRIYINPFPLKTWDLYGIAYYFHSINAGTDAVNIDDSNGGSTRSKIVSNQKLKQYLNYIFRYPNPMDL